METANGAMATPAPPASRPPLWGRRYYVHQIQTTYAVWIGVLLFTYSVLLFGLAFLTPYILPALKLISSAPLEERALAARQFLAMAPTIGPALIGLIVFATIFSIYLTHRLAGPLYRLEKCAKEIAQGNVSLRIRLRKRDELQELAGLLNEAVTKIDLALGEIRDREAAAQAALRRLADQLRTQPSNNPEVMKQIEVALAEGARIEEVLRRFSVSPG